MNAAKGLRHRKGPSSCRWPWLRATSFCVLQSKLLSTGGNRNCVDYELMQSALPIMKKSGLCNNRIAIGMSS
ncbi:hypothetical protein HPB50_014836 [Hyalomma asiaticum]|uniref:Uncharacterized protein n=1 Tax=Hyalomma asiaticum TaxID=266040 RepID=A0ACB7SVC2_HYAAI|nr:hypothetical protein HPB50_014836 [Hyalomma asiaticum]